MTRNLRPLDKDSERVVRFVWSPTQIAILAAGVFFIALGGIALTRLLTVGIDSPIDPAVPVGWWTRTLLMASIEVIIGLVMVFAGAQTPAPRIFYRVLGGVALAFGLVMAFQPSSFDNVLGAGRPSGVLYTLLGAGLLALGFGTPIVFERERTIVDTTKESPLDIAV